MMNRARCFRFIAIAILVLIAAISTTAQDKDKEAYNRILKQGLDALTSGKLDESIVSFRQCLELKPKDNICAYNLACSYSLKKDVKSGLDWLGKSIEWGYNDLDHVRQDSDLLALRQDVGFQALIKQLQRQTRTIRTPEVALDLIVMIEGSTGFGAGILFGKDRDRAYIATANHLVRTEEKAAGELRILTRMLPETWLNARLTEHFSRELDLAVLSVEGFATHGGDICSLPFDRIGDTEGLRRGTEVYPVGYPNAIRWGMPVTPDHVAQVSRPQIAFQSGFVGVGHSGGALITAQGDLVGMIRADSPPLALANDLPTVLATLRQWGYPIELRRSNTPSALFAAASASDANAVERLLKAPCFDLEERYDGWTPLQKAAENGATTIVRALLRAGSQTETRIANPKYNKWTALDIAAADGHADIVRALLDAGARADEPGSSDTSLELAVREGHREVVNMLRRAGAKTDFVQELSAGSPRERPLHVAARNGRVESARLLIDLGANVNDLNSNGATALLNAVDEVDDDMVKFLLMAGADPNVIDRSGNSPLSIVIVDAWREDENERLKRPSKMPDLLRIARMLLDAGARVDNVGSSGAKTEEERKTALGLASDYGQVELVKLLLRDGKAKINARDGEGRTALHHAAETTASTSANQLDLLRLLLDSGADVNALDDYKDPPLCRALWGDPRNPRITVVEILLKAGARSLMMDQCFKKSGRSWAPDAAIDRLLRSYGAKE